jgi:hypothetical protein
LYDRAIAIFQRALGADHPKVAICWKNRERLVAQSSDSH